MWSQVFSDLKSLGSWLGESMLATFLSKSLCKRKKNQFSTESSLVRWCELRTYQIFSIKTKKFSPFSLDFFTCYLLFHFTWDISHLIIAIFFSIPQWYPPSDPSDDTTRWQGIMIAIGFAPIADQTARTAFGRPIASAICLYVLVWPRGIFWSSAHTSCWNLVPWRWIGILKIFSHLFEMQPSAIFWSSDVSWISSDDRYLFCNSCNEESLSSTKESQQRYVVSSAIKILPNILE